MRRLHPQPADEATVAELYDVDRPSLPDGRPRVGICMVSSLDGSTVVEGRSAPLSSPTDTEVLMTLRRAADMILVGAGTVRAENYGPPARAGQRIGVVTASGDLDVTTDLFTSGAGFLVCTERTPDRGVDMLRAGTDEVDLEDAVRRLHEIAPDIGFVQAEGGAHLNGALLHAGLVDELHLNFSPRLVGGSGPRLAAGSGDVTSGFDLVHLAIDDESFLYTRWTRRC